MRLKFSYPIEQLRDYSTLFLRNEAVKWFNGDFGELNKSINRYDKYFFKREETYLKYLRYVYRVLRRDYPFEYIYKNEFLNQWIINELGNSDSLVFNEFRIGKAIADIVVFNGTSKVFEIKTGLDTDYRLSHQINEYGKLFNEIYLIVPEDQVVKYLKCNDKVGVLSYSTLNNDFSLVRKSFVQDCPDFSIIMKVLHTKEYKEVVNQYYGDLPVMSDFTQFELCKDLISKIPSIELNHLFVNTLKKRKANNLFFNKLNSEFNQISLSLNLNKIEKNNLINNLNTKIQKHVLSLPKSQAI